MIIVLGFICSFLASIFGATNSIISQKFNIDPPVLALYRGFGLAIVLLPFMLFVPAPTSWLFYVLVVVNGVMASFSFRRATEVIEKHGANIMSKFLTVSPVIVALIWWIINPTKFAIFVSDSPEKAIGSILCLIAMLVSMFTLEKNKTTHRAFIDTSPLFLLYTAQTFSCYFALQEVSMIQGVFYYPFIQGLLIGIFNYFIHIHHLHSHAKEKILQTVFDKKVLKGGLLLILSIALVRVFSNVSFKILPNPSYTNLIFNLQILWIYLASNKMKLQKTIPPAKGILLMIYAIMFIILTY